MWHLATSKGGKVLFATRTWRNRPAFPGNATTPTFPRPGPEHPGCDLWPPPGGRREPQGARGWDRGACERGNNRVHSGKVSAGPPDSTASPAARGRLVPPRGLNREQNARPEVLLVWSGRLSPPSTTYLPAEHTPLLKSLSLPFLRSETYGGKRCACMFVEHILLEFPFDDQRERWRLRRQVQGWPRLPAESCALRGGPRGPPAELRTGSPCPPSPPPGVAPFSSPAPRQGRWRSFSSSHLFSLTCFRSRGLP